MSEQVIGANQDTVAHRDDRLLLAAAGRRQRRASAD
jgi:hypothetical protein